MSRRRSSRNKPYGLGRFIIDLLLGFITGGLWWVFLLFRAVRGRN